MLEELERYERKAEKELELEQGIIVREEKQFDFIAQKKASIQNKVTSKIIMEVSERKCQNCKAFYLPIHNKSV